MTTMRAQLMVVEVTDNGYSDRVKFSAVCGNTPEDSTFSKATPSADLTMQILALRGVIKPGAVFYVDFTPAPAST